MPKFRKMPVEIEAAQWSGNLPSSWPQWLLDAYVGDNVDPVNLQSGQASINGDKLYIQTLEGTHTASIGDWIIRGIKGELYPCKPEIFAATYEQVA